MWAIRAGTAQVELSQELSVRLSSLAMFRPCAPRAASPAPDWRPSAPSRRAAASPSRSRNSPSRSSLSRRVVHPVEQLPGVPDDLVDLTLRLVGVGGLGPGPQRRHRRRDRRRHGVGLRLGLRIGPRFAADRGSAAACFGLRLAGAAEPAVGSSGGPAAGGGSIGRRFDHARRRRRHFERDRLDRRLRLRRGARRSRQRSARRGRACDTCAWWSTLAAGVLGGSPQSTPAGTPGGTACRGPAWTRTSTSPSCSWTMR